MICKQTNLRAAQELASAHPPACLANWKPMKDVECYGFLSVIITMGLQSRPCDDDYWSTEGLLACPPIKSIISRQRFKEIKHRLMVANPSAETNAQDKLAKVRPFLDLIRTTIKARYRPRQDTSLDESQCKCGHRYSRISYRGETKKPIADYVKIISLHCSHCGYCLDFVVDTRTESTHEMVLKVCAGLEGQPFRIATDRFYTSVDTAKSLLVKGLYMYGTVRTDRGIDSDLKPRVERPLEDGEHRWSMAPPGLLSCVWRDTKKEGVWFLSTCHDGRAAVGEVRRRKRGQPVAMKAAPQVAIDYNKYMGGCDRANSLRASYSTLLTHKRRWYMSLFYFGIDVLLVNALIYHNQRSPVDAQMSQKSFRVSVAHLFAQRALLGGQLASGSTTGPARKRHRSEELPPERKLPGPHLIVKADDGNQHMCKWCHHTEKKRNTTPYTCSTCHCDLHAHCFQPFHES